MINYCLEANILSPFYFFEAFDCLVEFRKNIYNEEYLTSLGLNERQIKAVLFAIENGKIMNGDYQELNNVSKRTATRELFALVDNFKTLIKEGTSGSSKVYKTVGPEWGQKLKMKNKLYTEYV